VLILEAGSEQAARGLTVRFRGFTLLKRRRVLHPRPGVAATADPKAELYEDLAPGGLTNHWSCAVPRFSPEDFADATRAGEEYAWPIGYDDIAPWYGRVEELLHIAGGSRDYVQLPAGNALRARELGPDWDRIAAEATSRGRSLAPMPYAYGAETTVTWSGTVFNSFVRLIKPELRSGRLTTRFDARVVGLEWSPQRRRVEAVRVRDARTGAESRMPCRAVVVAAGAICTPEILLASKSADFPDGLGNTHGVLGRYLNDHPLGKLLVDLSAPVSFHPPSYVTRPTLDRAPPLYAAACMQWTGTDALVKSLLARHPGRLAYAGFNVFGTMAPNREDQISLDSDRQPNGGGPALQLHIRHPPEARVALEKARDDLVDTLSAAGLQPRVRLWHVEPVGNSRHYAGSCRMHASPRFGMLGAWGRLHGVPNVAVADSSAFTTNPEKNPVLTSMTLAARAGHRLAEELRGGDL
jgi:choline dehydrogenase-like flavoprotein